LIVLSLRHTDLGAVGAAIAAAKRWRVLDYLAVLFVVHLAKTADPLRYGREGVAMLGARRVRRSLRVGMPDERAARPEERAVHRKG
jgi:hypothetical protein